MNDNDRGVFALDGVTGFLIATALLLSILVFLSVNAVSVQHANAENFYKILNEKSIGSGIGFGEGHTTSKQSDHIVDVK